MITQKEIISIAENREVPKSTIDKDWVLGHYLNAMYSLSEIKENFIFKGGTCISKCFVNNYRFSEDIDITLLDKIFIVNKNLFQKINHIAEKNSGAKFHIELVKPNISDNKEQGYKIIIKFWGADHHPNQKPLPPKRWQTSIKIDISYSEELVLGFENKLLYHQYSDNSKITNYVSTYFLNEIIAEKMRALIQRNRPRDIYDNWYLLSRIDSSEIPKIQNILFTKAHKKNIKIESLDQFVNNTKRNINKNEWESSLKHQLGQNNLPDFDLVYSQLTILIDKIINI